MAAFRAVRASGSAYVFRGQVVLIVVVMVAVWLPPSGLALDLVSYADLVLRHSDTAWNIQDSLVGRQLDLELAENQYEIQWVPLVSLGVQQGTGSQTFGIEAQRQTTIGPRITAGIRGDQRFSDEFVLRDSHSVSAYLRVSQGLFRRWGEKYVRAPLTRAELAAERERISALRRQQDLLLSAVQTFQSAVLSAMLVERTGQAMARAQANVEVARSRQSVGLVSKVDVYRAELALLTAEDNFRAQERNHVRNVEALYELIRRSPDGRLQPGSEIGVMVPVLPDDWEQELLDYRLDWQAHLVDRRLNSLAIHVAQRDTQPDVRLSVEVSQRGLGDRFDEAARSGDGDWAILLNLQSPLGNVRERTALSRELTNANRLARDEEALNRRIRRETREAWEDVLAEDRRREIVRQRLEQAASALELAQMRYERGLSDNIDVLDAELAFSDAEMDVARVQINYNLATVRLAHAVGILDLDWLSLALDAGRSGKGGLP